ncbi:transcription factor RF2a-like [Olea europaea subsp. europaea]|uniref:Transcription factor RF2a-like n=1 Tax=Olea europaea subsp. europaea TaxID=158383 RepID=A0A8S0ULA7_OLEEU|nr:transcription factor RF2a-like [Olea europaea subsp. europaea]
MAQPNSRKPINQNYNVMSCHSRSLSQPTFLTNSGLPPLSPFSGTELLASSNYSLKDKVMEETDVNRGPPLTPSFPRKNVWQGSDGLLLCKGHQRSSSDVPLGFLSMIKSSPLLVPISGQAVLGNTMHIRENLGNGKSIGLKRREMDTSNDNRSNAEEKGVRKSEGEVEDDLFNSWVKFDSVDSLNSSGIEDKDKDIVVCGTKMSGGDNNSTESESVSRHGSSSREDIKKTTAGDIAPPALHYRSLSMDSAFGNLKFGDESPIFLENPEGWLPQTNSMTENSCKLNLEFEHGQFSEVELIKIRGDEMLSEIAFLEPKRAKRILANRQSAARSKERKLHYISELEHKVQTLQAEATTLSAQVTILQKDYGELTSQNNGLKFQFQAMEQQAQLRDALHEALTTEVQCLKKVLTAEVQCLKLENMDLKEEERLSNFMVHQVPLKHHIFQMQHQQPSQIQLLSVAKSITPTTTSTPASA